MPPKAQPPPRDKLRRENIRRVFNYFYRPRGNSPYNTVFGPGSHDYSPVIARTTITTQQILTSPAALLTRLFIRIIAPLFYKARRSLPHSLAAYPSPVSKVEPALTTSSKTMELITVSLSRQSLV
ncbi:hypothetical protein GGP41_004394 [Bipolaris sorokiniana]|uniref:Uncharacterized protein n=1 Tax=Cochliobolus sativus TaxID=45130 RepID=A0A8H5ZK10_COCSA|nr:hypothetical protein GGP41_004394 [Bipolaris sorokiniana]